MAVEILSLGKIQEIIIGSFKNELKVYLLKIQEINDFNLDLDILDNIFVSYSHRLLYNIKFLFKMHNSYNSYILSSEAGLAGY